jgi:3-dehydroquinate dehydratase-1
MIKIGELRIDETEKKTCIPLMAETIGDMILQSKEIKNDTFDLVDFRAECFTGTVNLSQLWNAMITVSMQFLDDALIFSLRSKCLPAEFMTEKDYNNAIHFAIKTSLCDAVEIEDFHDADDILDAVDYAEEMGISTIISHELQAPLPSQDDIRECLTKMQQFNAPILRLYVPETNESDIKKVDAAIAAFRAEHPDTLVLSNTPGSPIQFLKNPIA